ncbi:TPA: DegT/DnrJ/EryC1/StrS family aminotransferase [Vibrio vulnificus]|nr:DegT/DnrJ/EryC1/StrS family aminotransferase [Vibrio vulnificus]
MMILLNKPISPNIKKLNKYLELVANNGWYTNFGPLHEDLTEKLEEYLGVKNLLLVSNGTFAIQVAAKALDISNTVTTPFSFVATTSSLLWQGHKVAFCDIDPTSFNISCEQMKRVFLENTEYDSLLATHVYGNPCDVERIEKIAKEFNKKVIYDAAHAFSVNVGSKSVLNFGDASTLSFHATKVFHTIEGGAIIFKDRDAFNRAKSLINFGINGDGTLGHPGINAKLNEYQSAVGLCLLDEISNIIEHRADLFSLYRQQLESVIEMPKWHEDASYNGAYMPICPSNYQVKQKICTILVENKIQYRHYFSPSLDKAYPFVENHGCPESNKVSDNAICLPLHSYMTKSDVLKITTKIKEAIL